MKKTLLIFSVFAGTIYSISAQQQIGNGSLEDWENVGTDLVEPINWNSFKTGIGGVAWLFGSTTIARSTDIRPGSIGQYSARIRSKSPISGVVANGNMTLGRIYMGNSTPTSSENYNESVTSDPLFSEALSDQPDSLVFWVKYSAAAGQEARVSAILHGNYNYRDGYVVHTESQNYKVAEISHNYPPTGGVWVRKSLPWNYTGPLTENTFVLITFTTNKTPGGGSAGDEVFIDDVQLIYNPTGGGDDNLPIVANDVNTQTAFNTPININILDHVNDPENDVDLSTLQLTSAPLGGNAVANTTTGIITYTPNNGFWGDDQFNYSICDGGEPQTCDNGTIFIGVDEELGIEGSQLDPIVMVLSEGVISFKNVMDHVNVEIIDTRGRVIATGKTSESYNVSSFSGVLLVKLSNGSIHRITRIVNL